ncbi:von Willebrand factor A [Methylophilales bacterium MBRSG12]|uniref:von Willebrand factor A n=1 Tax=Methylophilales bacterium MBRS-H7 TaxID=1623450 RepID=A0A0H4IWP7_9PROT|nr:von Willebrand factor A [Methylophilales bacterium MBRSF5]AKO65381.1 von Willebrand factor A [Methylophilales bacterium MBRS-H7]AKO66700.1 von Willebrand factor A [Methylophilales bacterium MBRSG12]
MIFFDKFKKHFEKKSDFFLLVSFILLLLALINPSIPVNQPLYNYILIADISQSMNTEDMKINQKTVSRLDYTKHIMSRLVEDFPCGTKVSIGMFAGVSVSATYSPIEVCENFSNINTTISKLDWRATWSGNTRIRESVVNLARLIRSFPESAQVVFFTDGEEAPKLHVFNTRDLEQFQGGNDWLFVGIGSDEGAPIPKYDNKNQLIGYWSNDSFALQPGIAQISESNIGVRDDNVASGATDRYMSKLDREYLEKLAKEIGGFYVDGQSYRAVKKEMKKQPPAWKAPDQFYLQPILCFLALLFFIARFVSKANIISLIRKVT